MPNLKSKSLNCSIEHNFSTSASSLRSVCIQDPAQWLMDSAPLDHLSDSDKEKFEKWGAGPTQKAPYSLIHKAFEFFVNQQPDAIAAEHLTERLTYEELDQQANDLAKYLKELGVKEGDFVGLFLKRSLPMLVGILAILKCHATYVPQDIGIVPSKQLSHIIQTAQIQIILTQDRFLPQLTELKQSLPRSSSLQIIGIETRQMNSIDDTKTSTQHTAHQPSATSISSTENSNEHELVCFLLFTSGTTGNPNGVKVTHINICNILLHTPGNLGIQPGDRVCQILNIGFDMAAWEILGCLANGGTLLIRDSDMQKVASEAEVIIATPSILQRLSPELCPNLKVVTVAGEPCPLPLAQRWSQYSVFQNSCGPTETTIINTLQRFDPLTKELTIGRPTPNNYVYILDKNLQPCKIGETGEMWAGGLGVTAGYLNNDALTAERYKPDPFLGSDYKMFRTRDLGRWTESGELEHHGRVDDQVKVKGFRIELDSISHIIESMDICTQAVTLKVDNQNLAAFVTPQTVSKEAVIQTISKALPYYCIPTYIVALEKLPITNRGKIDKRYLLESLSNPNLSSHSNQNNELVKPSHTEQPIEFRWPPIHSSIINAT